MTIFTEDAQRALMTSISTNIIVHDKTMFYSEDENKQEFGVTCD